MNNIQINGQSFSAGGNVTIVDGKVYVDGVDVTPEGKEISIVVNGDLNSLEVSACKTIEVSGNAERIKTASGSVTVRGDVNGNVKAMSGNIVIEGTVKGDVDSMSGSIQVWQKKQ